MSRLLSGMCVAVCCSVLQCVAVCCGVLALMRWFVICAKAPVPLNVPSAVRYVSCGVLQCVTVCCSVLQCVAVCCNVLQCVAISYLRKGIGALKRPVCSQVCVLQCVAVCCR